MLSPDLATRYRSARTDPALAVLEGFHAIKHAIRFGAEFESIVTNDSEAALGFAARLAPDVSSPLARLAVEVSTETFARLSPTPPETGLIAIARRRVTPLASLMAMPGPAPVVLLDSPSHSGNIGAAIRVAAGAGAAGVVTTGSNDPWNPGAIRGSAGLHFALPVTHANALDLGDRTLVAIDPEGDEPTRFGIGPRSVLAFGSERSGLSAALLATAARRVRIPMEPGVSSLNLATAVAVVLYAWRLGE